MAQAAVAPARSPFIAGPVYDSIFLIAAPLVAVLVFLPFGTIPFLSHALPEARFQESLMAGFIATVIYAHLFLVFFRSHLNTNIFRLYPARFIAAPVLLFASIWYSTPALAVVGAVAVWWDVYHSAMQTFGIGRIYDMKAGNDPLVGRRLDIIWNVVMYAGPILAGASLVTHLDLMSDWARVEWALFTRVPAYALDYSRYLTYGIIGFAVPFSVYYVFRYWQLSRAGYQVSFQKVFLYIILGFVSVFCWGFNSFGEAFFVMNFFHALQYFFLVWVMEGKNITAKLGLARFSLGPYLALAVFVWIATSFGVWATGAWDSVRPPQRVFEATILVVSIMHFWYDGFIWSVRRKQVA